MTNPYDDLAADYDEDIYPLNERAFVEPTVEAIAQLTPGRTILELAVGTGRIAIPLAKRGFQVTGIDISPAMLQQLKQKAGEHLVETIAGDMSQIQLNREFDLAYLVFNGITYLLTLEEQVACFKNAASHLRSGGVFIVETFIPRVDQILKDDTAPYALEEEYVGFDKYDRMKQLLTSFQFDLSKEHPSSFHTTHRYVWPSELELMGQLAGFEKLTEWGSWEGEPLTQDSDNVIMIWRKR